MSTDDPIKTARYEGVGNGMVIAAAIIVRVWGDEVQAQEILGAAGLTTVAAMRRVGVDAYDVWPLRKVIRNLDRNRRPVFDMRDRHPHSKGNPHEG